MWYRQRFLLLGLASGLNGASRRSMLRRLSFPGCRIPFRLIGNIGPARSLDMASDDERPSKIRKIQDETHEMPEGIAGRPTEDLPSSTSPLESLSEVEIFTTKAVTVDEPALSRNAMKRLRKKQHWEAGREFRKQKRKEKQWAKRQRQKSERAEAAKAKRLRETTAGEPSPEPARQTSIPMTFIIDCGFDEQMLEKEINSISSQVTRCYSENRKALHQPQIAISSFGGRMKTRFETILQNPHIRWTNVRIEEGDFVEVAQMAKAWMLETAGQGVKSGSTPESDQESSTKEGETVYLTADSDETLEELRPHSTYIIGGLVDKNRHKGICYRRAKDRGIRTAKLPIGEFLQMSSRTVLTTNHVYEIMLKWLEFRDWGKAFMSVIPKRKGGVLKSSTADQVETDDGEDEGLDEDEKDNAALPADESHRIDGVENP